MKVALGNSFGGSPPFRPGEEVMVVAGPFVEYRGHVASVDAHLEKVSVVISVFGRDVETELGFADVRKT